MPSRPAPFIPPRLRAFLLRVPLLVRFYRAVRRGTLLRERNVLVGLTIASLVVGIGAAKVSPAWFSPSMFILLVLLGGLLLRVRTLFLLLSVTSLMMAYDATQLGRRQVGPGLIVTLIVTAVLALLMARARERLGVQWLRGEAMLLELRDRLRAQSQLPKLPRGWGARAVLKQAGGSSFGGDFLVSTLRDDCLQVALVDVSGKGLDAGTRALMLSGVFGGLLGSVPTADFLPACNAYLHRQREPEGFVTAVHLCVDLASGRYVITSAGHPPAVQFNAAQRTWRRSSAKGVVLGVVSRLHTQPETGVLGEGDAILLYTDGLIEAPGRDIDAGIDRLLREAERLVNAGFRHGATELVRTMTVGYQDDCALVLIWRI